MAHQREDALAPFHSGPLPSGGSFPTDGSFPFRSLSSGGFFPLRSFPSGASLNSGGSFPCTGGVSGRGSPVSPPTRGTCDFTQPWGQDSRPPGGFMSYLNHPQLSQNAQFGGGPSQFGPSNVPLSSSDKFASPGAVTSSKFIELDSDDGNEKGGSQSDGKEKATSQTNGKVQSSSQSLDKDDVRTDKRLLWKQDEDVRVMSAWLKHSIDSINGNDKKGEKYWEDVANEYNLTTSQNRKRNVKQVKERWHKINRWINWFNDAYIKVRRVYTSGHSDEMWIANAHKVYEEDHQGAHFVLMDVWYICRDQAKWIAYNNQNKKIRKRKEAEKGEDNEETETQDSELPRPMGQKAAKRAALGVKGKNKHTTIDVDELDRFEKIQSNNHANRVKVLEMQQKLLSEKEKASKLALLAAKEQKNAKVVEKETKMLDTYKSLLTQDTSMMCDEVRAEHVLALKCLRKRLFLDMFQEE